MGAKLILQHVVWNRKKQVLVVSLILLCLLCVLSLSSGILKLVWLYPHMERLNGTRFTTLGGPEYYQTSDSPEILANWFEEAKWKGDSRRMFWVRTVNLGVIKLNRSVNIYRDGQTTMIKVTTGIYILPTVIN